MLRSNRLVLAAYFLAFTVGQGKAQPPSPTRPPAFHLVEATIDDIRGALKSGQITCRQLVAGYLMRIEAYNQSGPGLNAVQILNPHALEDAERLDAISQISGARQPLYCIPVLVKDQVETSDMATSYGSAVFKVFVPKRDATVVKRLKASGAIILGKTTMGEFASGFFGSAAGAIHNAYDPTRHASGSSGGTGSAITANFAAVGIGEDTGGSIRGPAAVSSLVGLRPTVPLVSRFGMLPARPTSDTLGPITRTVRDAAIVLDVIAGYDPNDPITADAVGHIPSSYTTLLSNDGLRGARIGIIREPMDTKTDPASADYKKVRSVTDRAIADLSRLGAELVDPVSIPELKERVVKLYADNEFETEHAINNYFSQHDNAPARTLRDILLSGKVVPSRTKSLMNSIGKSTDDIGYLQFLNLKEQTRQAILTLMADKRLDALVYATFDHQPAVIPPDVMTNPDVDAMGVGNNRRLSPVIGFPAITVPAGFTSDGLPVGIEFMARPYSEGLLLKLGYAYEQSTRNRKPPSLTPPLQAEP
jgi:amidase